MTPRSRYNLPHAWIRPSGVRGLLHWLWTVRRRSGYAPFEERAEGVTGLLACIWTV